MSRRAVVVGLAVVLGRGVEVFGQSAPIGWVDSVTENLVAGWAYDADQGFNPVQVRVYEGPRVVVEGPAYHLRPDLPAAFLGRHHGFGLALPPLTPGAHVFRIFAVDDSGTEVLLGKRPLMVAYQNPGGQLESLVATAETVEVSGWAFDRDLGAQSLAVHLYIDHAYAGWTIANQPHAAAGAALGTSARGFRFSIPRPRPGCHLFEVYGINAGPGWNRRLDAAVSMELDLTEHMAPLGARLAGTTTARWNAGDGTFRFVFDDGSDLREYVVDPADPWVAKGGINVRETVSGVWPASRGGTIWQDLSGDKIAPENFVYIPDFVVTMAEPDFDGRTLTLRYLDTYQGAARSKEISYRLEGKTLIVDVVAPGGAAPADGNYHGLYQGRLLMPGARSLVLPYMLEPVHVNASAFVSRIIDPVLSHGNATLWEGPFELPAPEDGLRHARLMLYAPDSAGRVQALRERLYLTVSDTIEPVFTGSNVVPGPHRDDAGRFVVYDTWGVDRTPLNRSVWKIPFAEQALHFQRLKQLYGLDHVMVIRHNWGSHFDFACPKIYPASSKAGGDAGFLALSHLCRMQGWLFAAHENVSCMFGPTPALASPPWYEPWRISLDADLLPRGLGALFLNGAVIHSFAIAPHEQIGIAERHSSYLAGSYYPNAGFADVQTWFAPVLDLDASQSRSKTFAEGVRDLKDAALVLREAYDGPLSGESPSEPESWTLAYAGYVDALERELVGQEDGLVIPDFELRVVQPLQANQGMGYLSRFFKETTRAEPDFPAVRHHDLIRSRTIAYGHTGFISDTLMTDPRVVLGPITTAKVFSEDQIVKEYYLLQALQARMLEGPVASIHYVENVPKTLSQKLRELAIASTSQEGFLAAVDAAFYGPRLAIRYQNGLEVCVNCSRTSSWTVVTSQATLTLPPSGWAAWRQAGGDDFHAFTGMLPGSATVVSDVRAPEYGFTDDRGLRLMTIRRGGTPSVFLY